MRKPLRLYMTVMLLIPALFLALPYGVSAEPTVRITSPDPFITPEVTGPDVAVSGTASYGDNASMAIAVDKGQWTPIEPAALWNITLTLEEGEHNISVRCSDDTGTDYYNITVKVVYRDTEPPEGITGLWAETGNVSGEVILHWDRWEYYDYANGTELPGGDRYYLLIYIYQGDEPPSSIEDMTLYEKYLGLDDWEEQSQHQPYLDSFTVSNLRNNKKYWFAVVPVDKWGNANTTLEEGENLASGVAREPPTPTNLLMTLCLPLVMIGAVFLLLYHFAPGKRLKKWKAMYRDALRPYFYVAPAMIALLALTFYPVAYGFYLSFTNMYGGNIYSYDWVWFENYIDIFSDPANRAEFLSITAWTLVWTISNVTLHVTLGLLFALLLNRKIRGKAVYRTFLILPWAVPAYISCLIWKGMFQRFGAINQFLMMLGMDPLPWLTKTPYAYLAVIITNVWLGFPFMMLTFLGGLQAIPQDLYEAAEVDGVSKWDQFRHITLPLLKPTLVPAATLGFIWTFNMFNVIYLVTGGGPNHATDILITYVYNAAFVHPFRYGFAAAYSVIIFFMLVLFTQMIDRINRSVSD